MHSHERWIICRYVANMARSRGFTRPPRVDGDIFAWIETHARSLGLPTLATSQRSHDWDSSSPRANAADWKAWRSAAIDAARSAPPTPSPLQKRLDWLTRACALDESQTSVLGLLARATRSPELHALVEAIGERNSVDFAVPDDVGLYPFLETSAERRELSATGRLAELGLIDAREGARLSDVVRRLLALPRFNSRRVGSLLLGEPAKASLAWTDFEHLGDLRDLAARMVVASGGARGSARHGVNLLFHGVPGTGKSEFAKTLGARVGFSVQFCGETTEGNAEPNRRERIAALLIANAIGGVARKTIVVIDEADDLFAGFDDEDDFDRRERRGSKVFMNRLLERSAAPTIWITNNVGQLGPAIIRRMNLAVCFPKPALAVRKTMVTRIASGVGFQLDAAATLDLARAPASPALIENAIRSAAHIRGSAIDARRILDGGLRALGRHEAKQAPAPIAFDPALSSADCDLVALAEQVARSKSNALSFCLSGPPGSGKSAYARHLAERLGLDLLERRYSDLSSKWVGESEKAIAVAFEEAADLRAFLIFDEADSLLRDRSAARNSWEITQVNEMLTRMERHPYPFACTTNALELLDPAATRRFLFKARFLPMTSPQVAEAYRLAFGIPAPGFVLKLVNLTPSDFATVARKARVFDERDPRVLAKWIEAEALAKPDAERRRIGF